MYVIVTMYFTTFEVLSCIETLVGHVMCLKGLIAATFESSEPLHLLRLNGRVGKSTKSLIDGFITLSSYRNFSMVYMLYMCVNVLMSLGIFKSTSWKSWPCCSRKVF